MSVEHGHKGLARLTGRLSELAADDLDRIAPAIRRRFSANYRSTAGLAQCCKGPPFSPSSRLFTETSVMAARVSQVEVLT